MATRLPSWARRSERVSEAVVVSIGAAVNGIRTTAPEIARTTSTREVMLAVGPTNRELGDTFGDSLQADNLAWASVHEISEARDSERSVAGIDGLGLSPLPAERAERALHDLDGCDRSGFRNR